MTYTTDIDHNLEIRLSCTYIFRYIFLYVFIHIHVYTMGTHELPPGERRSRAQWEGQGPSAHSSSPQTASEGSSLSSPSQSEVSEE